MGKFVNHEGETFGRLKVIEFIGSDSNRNTKYLCECTCGNKVEVVAYSLVSGQTRSCGCLQKELMSKRRATHGMSHASEYYIWSSIKGRCYNKNDKGYVDYGGRGIDMYEGWKNSFEQFIYDMGRRPNENYSIERADVNKGYHPDNCTWVLKEKQARNKRKSKNNTTGFTGVSLRKESGKIKGYVAAWSELDGKWQTRYFSIRKYGKKEAFDLACKARKEAITRLNKEGAGYSENHGK